MAGLWTDEMTPSMPAKAKLKPDELTRGCRTSRSSSHQDGWFFRDMEKHVSEGWWFSSLPGEKKKKKTECYMMMELRRRY
jgi:hypothetical protein